MKRKTNRGINFTLNIFDETLQEKVKIGKKNLSGIISYVYYLRYEKRTKIVIAFVL